MPRQRLKDVEKHVVGVRIEIERWRATRVSRGRMPEDLWLKAVALARSHGVWAVARGLRVSYDSLKARMSKVQGAASRDPVADNGSTHPGFTTLDLPSMEPADAGLVIELGAPDGATIVIRAPSVNQVDLQGLVSAFWRRRV